MDDQEDNFGYQVLTDRYGAGEIGKVNSKIIEQYNDKLPLYIIEIWRNYGLTSHGNGYLRLVIPSDYANIVRMFGFDSEKFMPFAVNSFGTIYCWNGQYVYQLNPYLGDMFLAARIPIDSFFAFGFIPKDSKDLKMHRNFVKKLGDIKENEIFGNDSAASPLENSNGIKKMDALKKLARLAKNQSES